ncbi:hypothetical protein K466DRAFT_278307 [Polyporus arcularius HHB13444]|uniref:Uncharacterized protein n=1 Tax=Polyporus arcularius HHB13444 TaxID=1314778 RepID=A0A5C3PQL3_9APHY|nr:hypothetical protein K466DRAFT_278307 [Polyporus arcularius HHB13444]
MDSNHGHPGHLIMTLCLRFSRICCWLVDFLLHGHRTLTAFIMFYWFTYLDATDARLPEDTLPWLDRWEIYPIQYAASLPHTLHIKNRHLRFPREVQRSVCQLKSTIEAISCYRRGSRQTPYHTRLQTPLSTSEFEACQTQFEEDMR